MLDGVSTMDTGNNGQMLQINVDAIAEVEVLTQGYQAEYGRASGLQISASPRAARTSSADRSTTSSATPTGTRTRWANQQNGHPKAVSKQRDWGYTLGGPVGKPGGDNKLFFFYAHEFRPRTTGGRHQPFPRADARSSARGLLAVARQQRCAGQPDPRSVHRPAVHGGDTRGCFQDGGVLGRIPQNRLYPLGLNILNLWPLPNARA